MRTKARKAPLDPDSSERRRLPRKDVLLNAVVAGLDGEIVFDCTIKDMNAGSAQIGFTNEFPLPAQIYLLDTSSRTAHLANVSWSNSESAGLAFVRSFAIGIGLQPQFKFLWRLLLGAKLREVYRVVASGVPVGLAFNTVGLSESQLEQMARYAGDDEKFARLLVLAKDLLSSNQAEPVPVERRSGRPDRRH
jgi:hypothetical protein